MDLKKIIAIFTDVHGLFEPLQADTENGFKVEEILVRYDCEKKVYSILNCDNPSNIIEKYASLTFEEKSKR